MPKIEVEITRIRTITENLTIEVEVPQSVIDDDELYEWVEENADWQNPDGEASDEDIELNGVEQLDD